MSNRKRHQGPNPLDPSPRMPTNYVNAFRYAIDGSVTTIWMGRDGEWHLACSMLTTLALEMAGKLSISITGLANQAQPPPQETPKS